MFCPACGTQSAAGAKLCAACGAALPDQARGSAASGPAARLPFGALWRRFLALLVDLTLLGVLSATVLVFVDSQPVALREDGMPEGSLLGVTVYVVIAVWLLYFPAFEQSPLQATPGKRLLDLKIAAQDGGRPGLARAIGRNLAKVLSVLLLFPLGFLIAGLTSRKQALHDLVSGSLVLRRTAGPEDLVVAAIRNRGAGWWCGLIASVGLSLVVLSLVSSTIQQMSDTPEVKELRQALGLMAEDEPPLIGKGAEP